MLSEKFFVCEPFFSPCSEGCFKYQNKSTRILNPREVDALTSLSLSDQIIPINALIEMRPNLFFKSPDKYETFWGIGRDVGNSDKVVPSTENVSLLVYRKNLKAMFTQIFDNNYRGVLRWSDCYCEIKFFWEIWSLFYERYCWNCWRWLEMKWVEKCVGRILNGWWCQGRLKWALMMLQKFNGYLEFKLLGG
jgi:hypothetical protein